MFTPAEVTANTSRRTAVGLLRAMRAAMTPPMDWATKSTGPSIVTSTSRTRSSMLLILGSWGWSPRPGQPKNTLPHSSGKSFATGCQNAGEPPAPGKNKILRISTPSSQVERILYPLVQKSAIGHVADVPALRGSNRNLLCARAVSPFGIEFLALPESNGWDQIRWL